MRQSSLYGHVAELLDLVVASRQPADTIVDRFTRSRRYLGARDRRFISGLLYDLLRHHARLSTLVREGFASFPGVPTPARINGVQLCVAHALHVKGLTPDAILPDLGGLWRTTTTDIDPLQFFTALSAVRHPLATSPLSVERLSFLHSLPGPLVESILNRWGEERGGIECAALNTEGPVVLRVNTLRCSREECRDELEKRGIPSRPTLLSPDGLTLERRVNLSGLDLFRDGWCEPQDEGSQLLSRILHPGPGEQLVDACAGGGGKTLHCAALMGNEGRILALDVDAARLENLDLRVRRGGITIVEKSILPASGELSPAWSGRADAVLVDAPCTGTGRYRRNPATKLQFDVASLRGMVRLQESVLSRSALLTRPGGRLVYATCSLLREEDEGVVERFLEAHSEFRLVDGVALLRGEGIDPGNSGPYVFFTPAQHGTDGFFAAAMVRVDSSIRRGVD